MGEQHRHHRPRCATRHRKRCTICNPAHLPNLRVVHYTGERRVLIATLRCLSGRQFCENRRCDRVFCCFLLRIARAGNWQSLPVGSTGIARRWREWRLPIIPLATKANCRRQIAAGDFYGAPCAGLASATGVMCRLSSISARAKAEFLRHKQACSARLLPQGRSDQGRKSYRPSVFNATGSGV